MGVERSSGMIPHNEHILMKYAKAHEAERLAEANAWQAPEARAAQEGVAPRRLLRVATALSAVAGAALALAWMLT
jgi:hypothetical protein